jgi:ABC-type antimicrobial peptide transport system permease subunit
MINLLRPFAMKRNRITNNYAAIFQNVFITFYRQMKRNPYQNLVNIGGLTVGFCVVFLTVRWINHHASFDRFHADLDNIYQVKTTSKSSDGSMQTYTGISFEIMEQAKNEIPEIVEATRIISNWRWPSEQCLKVDANSQCIYSKGIFADTSFFKIFDFQILTGRQKPLRDAKSIALSATVAKKLFGTKNPVGETYLVDNHYEVTIAAIYEDVPTNSSLQFEFIAPLELAYALRGQNEENLKEYNFITYVKLQQATQKIVESKMNGLPIREKYQNSTSLLHPYRDVHLYTDFENGVAIGGLIDYIKIIGLFAVFILLMSTVNFINLTTAHASIRGKEIGVRKVNGASQRILHLQLLFETFLKVSIAVVLAMVIAHFALPRLGEILGQSILIDFDGKIIAQILLVIIVTTLLSGIYPAIIMSRFNPIQIIKNLPFTNDGKGIARRGLTVVQISISGIIVILTTVFYLQLDYLQNENTGYDREGIMMMEPTIKHIRGFNSFKTNLLQHHQIKALGICNNNMIKDNNRTNGVDWKGKNENDDIFFRMVGGDDGLIEVLELEFIDGRGFNNADTTDQIILTEAAVKHMNLENPVGQTIDVWNETCKISGVVKDFNTESLHNELLPTILYEIKPQNAGTFYIRYNKDQPIASFKLIEEEYTNMESFFNMKYKILDEEYQKAYLEEKTVSRLSIFVTLIALFIAVLGILGLSSFNILRRYREIGLRKIFGATSFQIIQILSKEFVVIAVVANLIAWAFSLWAMDEWLSGFAYRIDTPYAVLFLNLIITLVIILTLVGIKALKVTRLNPVEVVRNE